MTKRKNVILERIDVLVDKIEMIDIQLNEINENRKAQYMKTINNVSQSRSLCPSIVLKLKVDPYPQTIFVFGTDLKTLLIVFIY